MEREIENIIQRLLRLENEVFKKPANHLWIPIKLSEIGKKTFPNLIGEKAYRVISRHEGKVNKNMMRIRILGKKVLRTMSKDFWEEK